MIRTTWVWILTAAVGLAVGGCPRPTPLELTDAQKAAVRLVAEQTTAAAAALNLLHPLSDTRLNLEDIAAIGVFGTCPVVSFVAGPDQAAMQFSYGILGAGCTADRMANQRVTGMLDVIVGRAARTTTANLDPATIGGRSVSGPVAVTIANAIGGVTLDGTCDIATVGVGRFSGEITVGLERTGILRIPAGDVVVDDGAATVTVVFNAIAVNPVNNGNFVPQGGTARFTVTESDGSPAATLLVTFTSQSPVTGTVRVQVDNGLPVNYQVSGLTGGA